VSVLAGVLEMPLPLRRRRAFDANDGGGLRVRGLDRRFAKRAANATADPKSLDALGRGDSRRAQSWPSVMAPPPLTPPRKGEGDRVAPGARR